MLALAHRLTNAGHASHVQAVAVEAVAGEALGDAHAAAVGAAIQDPTLLRLQSLVAPSLGACGECGDSGVRVGPCPDSLGPLLNCPSRSRAVGGAVGPGCLLRCSVLSSFSLCPHRFLGSSTEMALLLFISALRRSLQQYLCFPVSLSLSPPDFSLFLSLSLPIPPAFPSPSAISVQLGPHLSAHHSGLSTHQHSFHLQVTPQALGRSHGCHGTGSASGCPGRMEQEPQIHRRGHHRPQSPACRRVASRRGPPVGRRAQVAVGRGHTVGRVVGTTQAHREGPGKVDLGLGHTRRGVQSHLAVGVHMQGGAARCTGLQSHLQIGAKPNNQLGFPDICYLYPPEGRGAWRRGWEGLGLRH